MSKTPALQVQHTFFSFLFFLFFLFIYFFHFLTSLYDYDVKILNLAFYRGRDQNKTIFSEVRYSPQASNQAKLTTIDKLNTAE